MSIGFFLDSGLSQPAARISATAAADGDGSSDHRVWLGGTDATREHVAASGPGVDQIVVSIADSGGGMLLPASALTLAMTQVALDATAPGNPLAVGTAIAGGSSNAVSVWLRVDAPEIDPDIYDNLTLVTNPLISRVV